MTLGVWGDNPILLESDFGTEVYSASSDELSKEEAACFLSIICGKNIMMAVFAGFFSERISRICLHIGGLFSWMAKSLGFQMPLRSLGKRKIDEWVKNARNPRSVHLCCAIPDKKYYMCLPSKFPCIHPLLINWGLRLLLLQMLAQFCAFLGVPVEQLFDYCLWILTCSHVYCGKSLVVSIQLPMKSYNYTLPDLAFAKVTTLLLS